MNVLLRNGVDINAVDGNNSTVLSVTSFARTSPSVSAVNGG